MFSQSLTQAALLACLAISTVHAAVPQISIKGTKFFYSNGTQYYMKGKSSTASARSWLIVAQELPISSHQLIH